MDISVIIATRNRAKYVKVALEALQAQENVSQDAVEILAVDNASSDSTAEVIQQSWPRFPVTYLYEAIAGKSVALNRAVVASKGELIAFTDDDAIPGPEWLQELIRAAREFREEQVFCGPIIPDYEGQPPAWLKAHQFESILFARFEPPCERGELPGSYIPFGPNFMVRRSAISGLYFRTDLGPSAGRSSLLGEETHFLCELRRRIKPPMSRRFIYVPSATVSHVVEEGDMEPHAIRDRFFRFGRTHVAREHTIGRLSAQFGLRLPEMPIATPEQAFEHAAEINFYLGQLYEASRRGEDLLVSKLNCFINHKLVSHLSSFLGPAAHEFVSSLYGRSSFPHSPGPPFGRPAASRLQCPQL
jgi:glycosyltransferase involved in cell wall biosynthesis